MHTLRFTAQTSSNGVVERDFLVGEIPGVLWSPASGPDRAPLVLLGHGGGRTSKAPGMTGRAHRLVTDCGFSVAAIDAPGHGGRPRTATDEREIAAMQQAMTAGEPVGSIVVPYNADIAERAVPEWQATLDALQELPEIGAGPVGYFGLNMGTAIGVPLTAVEPRITAAVLGIFWYDESLAETARRITVPIEFVLQWDDENIPRESGLALFDAFSSKEKSLHANSGAHKEVPRFEVDSAVRFFARHLGGTVGASI
ncbi:MAG TPA: alpha/beta hydrolase [Actinophytocola sp.]|jgi:pimeloyl-ACP methyl ester carboxylesterase|uniref:alpha/beta hydrolase family protein n=1 Tax=Actinophytocola sp. TaxID=1872138 RepID=UPI002F942C4B